MRMLKGEGVVLGGALMRPEKSNGVDFSASMGRGFLASATAGRVGGFPPKIPSSSLAELEAELPSGDVVGGGDVRGEEHVDAALKTGEFVSDRAEIVVLGESVTESPSWGRIDTPSSMLL